MEIIKNAVIVGEIRARHHVSLKLHRSQLKKSLLQVHHDHLCKRTSRAVHVDGNVPPLDKGAYFLL